MFLSILKLIAWAILQSLVLFGLLALSKYSIIFGLPLSVLIIGFYLHCMWDWAAKIKAEQADDDEQEMVNDDENDNDNTVFRQPENKPTPQFNQQPEISTPKTEPIQEPPQSIPNTPTNDSDRHQAELDRYIQANHSSAEIGKIYERQIGYMLEQKGYRVIYHGIMRGVEDEGIDLIAKRDNQILLIQAKNWGENRPIRENQINQFKGSADFFVAQNHKQGLQWAYVFVSSQAVSERAAQVAKQHKIKLIVQPLNKGYPMIKCKVNKQENTRIFHLPTDQQYDKIIIKPENGDCYAHSVFEAEFKGFRRAYRWRGGQTSF